MPAQLETQKVVRADGGPSAVLPARLRPPAHPLLPFPLTEQEILSLDTAEGQAAYARALNIFQQLLTAAEWDENQPLASDPHRGTMELPHWGDADFILGIGSRESRDESREQEGAGESMGGAAAPALPRWDQARARTLTALRALRDRWLAAPYVAALPAELRANLGRLPEELLSIICNLLVILGGNRSGKSEYCAVRCMQSAIDNPGSRIICVAGDDLDQSKENQQRPLWKHLPVEWKLLSGKRDPRGIFKINYSRNTGFTTEQCILPNGSDFLFYGSQRQEPSLIQGKVLGHQGRRCVGFWADESVTLPWMRALIIRASYYNAIGLWSFTPIDGMTPAIKELLGEARTLLSLFAEMMSDRKHLADCPRRHMPYIQKPREPSCMFIYFHTQLSPFGAGGRTFYEALREQHTHSTDELKGRYGFGHTKDIGGRKFPAYGAHNVIPVAKLPAIGTIRTFNDPHGSRPWFTWWVLTTPGKEPSHYVIREWPDEGTYGQWAVPTMRPVSDETRRGWDGDPGPAQKPNGWGIADYKALWMERERVVVPVGLRNWLKENRGLRLFGRGNVQRPTPNAQRSKEEQPETRNSELETFLNEVTQPWHREIIKRALRRGLDLERLDEGVFERYFDARFMNADYADDDGGTCLRYKLEEEQKHPTTGEILPACDNLREATGNRLEIGYGMVTDLLSWNPLHPDGLIPGINAPRLYISEECTQTRWAFENFTGRAGETGACKEPMDLARHLAEAEPVHVDEGTFQIIGRNER